MPGPVLVVVLPYRAGIDDEPTVPVPIGVEKPELGARLDEVKLAVDDTDPVALPVQGALVEFPKGAHVLVLCSPDQAEVPSGLLLLVVTVVLPKGADEVLAIPNGADVAVLFRPDAAEVASGLLVVPSETDVVGGWLAAVVVAFP